MEYKEKNVENTLFATLTFIAKEKKNQINRQTDRHTGREIQVNKREIYLINNIPRYAD